MNDKLCGVFLLRQIIKELKKDPENEFWESIEQETSWTKIIKKLFTSCKDLDGKKIYRYQDYDIGRGNKQIEYELLKELLAKELGFSDNVWEHEINKSKKNEDNSLPHEPCSNGITQKELSSYVDTFKKSFTPPEKSNNPLGRSTGTGGSEATLLGYIIDDITEEGFLGTDIWPQIIPKIAPNSIIDKRVKNNINNWKNKRTGIKSDFYDILEDISNYLEFDTKYWFHPSGLDTQEVARSFKKKYLKEQQLKLDINDLNKYLPKKKHQTKEETQALQTLKDTKTIADINDIFFQQSNYKSILDTSPTDNFLNESIKILYEKGAYKHIESFLLGKLIDSPLYESTEMKLLRAHIYGSEIVDRFDKAIDILDQIEESDLETFADNKTALISNIIRNALRTMDTSNTESIKELFVNTTDKYADIFQRNLDYYPGINYAYMLDIGQHIFPDEDKFNDDEIEILHEDSQASIENGKRSNSVFDQYYAYISDVEFKALLGTFDPIQAEETLTVIKPTQDMLMRTNRQVIFYLNTLTNASVEAPIAILELSQFLQELVASTDNK